MTPGLYRGGAPGQGCRGHLRIPTKPARAAAGEGYRYPERRPARLLAPCTDQTGTPAFGDFYFQASDGLVALPAAGYNYDIDWTPMSAGLSPAGMAASFAARSIATEASGPQPEPDFDPFPDAYLSLYDTVS